MSAPAYIDDRATVHLGDCLDVLAEMPDNSVDAIITDPPYGLANTTPTQVVETITAWISGDRKHVPAGRGFMGKSWDAFVPPVAVWDEALRVLKPGGHALVFAGSRTHDLMTLGLRLAGFEIRDSVAWLYGSGFPKSLDVSKAIDKRPGVQLHAEFARHLAECREAAGLSRADVAEHVVGTRTGAVWNWEHHQFPEAKWWPALRDLLSLDDEKWGPVVVEAERAVVGQKTSGVGTAFGDGEWANGPSQVVDITAPATPAAQQWAGWGTALKPAFEPIVVARKPLTAPGVNVLDHVELSLRAQGVTGEIAWTSGSESAPSAGSRTRSRTSSVTRQQGTDTASASPVDASGTQLSESANANGSAPSTQPGATPTASASAHIPDAEPPSCETKSSPPTAMPAPAVTSAPTSSSPSTTSTGVGPPTGARSDATSTSSSAARGSRPVTESFAGTATGLTGSRVTVRIDRLADGTFVWPDGLPTYVPGGPITVAANVLQWGTGALNIDGCRVESTDRAAYEAKCASVVGLDSNRNGSAYGEWTGARQDSASPAGRWPTNVALDSDMAAELDEQTGDLSVNGPAVYRRDKADAVKERSSYVVDREGGEVRPGYGDSGGASRFFPVFKYQAKAPARERPSYVKDDGTKIAHVTVKPLALMRWLVRLVTPPGGLVLEPFAGSGATVEAALLEGFRCVAVEREADYLPLIEQRITRTAPATTPAADDLVLFDGDAA